MTFYDAIRQQYYKFNIGKYSNQYGFFRFNYGFLPLGNFPLNLPKHISKLGYTYGKIFIEYYSACCHTYWCFLTFHRPMPCFHVYC